ncbi:hypothetical protein NL676_031730 [Syzygium grande]|nr:hypothetical protein NL676_031730 [Syzygium grande]
MSITSRSSTTALFDLLQCAGSGEGHRPSRMAEGHSLATNLNKGHGPHRRSDDSSEVMANVAGKWQDY